MFDLKPTELFLIVLVVLTVILVQRSRQAPLSGPAVLMPETVDHCAPTGSIHRIPIGGGEIVFTRTADGHVVTTAEGFVGQPPPEIVRGAQQRLIGWQMAKNQPAWFE